MPRHSSSYLSLVLILFNFISFFLSNVVEVVKDQKSLIYWLYKKEYWFFPSIWVLPLSSRTGGEWILLTCKKFLFWLNVTSVYAFLRDNYSWSRENVDFIVKESMGLIKTFPTKSENLLEIPVFFCK